MIWFWCDIAQAEVCIVRDSHQLYLRIREFTMGAGTVHEKADRKQERNKTYDDNRGY